MNKVYRIVTNQILEQLRRGTVPWRRDFPRGSRLVPRNLVSNREYRGINRLLLLMAQRVLGYETPVWLTYRQAERAGGHVRKGERSSIVVFWKLLEKRKRQDAGDQGERSVSIPILRYYRVFNVDQCELPDKVEDTLQAFRVPRLGHDPVAGAERIVAQMPQRPEIVHRSGSAHYEPSADIVRVPPLEVCASAEAHYSALFHELIHATGHASRLGRGLSTDQASREYALEELTAELGSCFLRMEVGISTVPVMENSAAYIAGWLTRLANDQTLVVRASTQAQKAVDFILDRPDGSTEEAPESQAHAA